MGFWDEITHAADDTVHSVEHDVTQAAGQVTSGVERVAGQVVDAGAHVVGAGLSAVGLSGAAQTVERWGEHTADALGAPERQLGQSGDPTELIHGDPAALSGRAQDLTTFASAFTQTSQGMAAVDTAHWSGPAAEAFRARYTPQPKRWDQARQACAEAATALADYAHTVTWAQGQAGQAIDLYQRGQQATHQAQADHNAAVAAYNADAADYNALAARGINPGAPPHQPVVFTDPGAALRAQAQELLDRARQQRDSAAAQAATAITTATQLAPTEPTFGQRLTDDEHDLVKAGVVEYEHLAGGIVKGVAGIADAARSANPLDVYNLDHPAQFVDGVSTTAAGLLHTLNHPQELLQGMVGGGWGTDPAQALGQLIPNVALGVATDGAATAADTGASVAERAATAGIDNAGAGLGRAEHDLSQIYVNEPTPGPSAATTPEAAAPIHQPPTIGARPGPDASAAAGITNAGRDLGGIGRELDDLQARIHTPEPSPAGPEHNNPDYSDPRYVAGPKTQAAFRAKYGATDKRVLAQMRARAPDVGLTDDDINALDIYTGMAHQDINAALRSGDAGMLTGLDPQIRQAVSGLNKLPDFQGSVYRGIDIAPHDMDAFVERYTPGHTVAEPAFTSTDKNIGNPGNVEFVIDSTSGKDISWLKDPSVGQQEILFAPGQRFTVIGHDFDDSTNQRIIYLRDEGR